MFALGRGEMPQGLKPSQLWPFTARLKSFPDTKHESSYCQKARAFRGSPRNVESSTARLNRLRKNSCLYKGTTLQVAEKLMFCVRARLYRLRKNSCFVSGHDFSRAVKARANEGFSP
jgi:hypothetical protein